MGFNRIFHPPSPMFFFGSGLFREVSTFSQCEILILDAELDAIKSRQKNQNNFRCAEIPFPDMGVCNFGRGFGHRHPPTRTGGGVGGVSVC